MSHFAALADFVCKHPLAEPAWLYAEKWQRADGGLPHTITAGMPVGDALRDFGHIIPYLWLIDKEKAAAFAKNAESFRLLRRDGRIYAEDNLHFVQGSYLYAEVVNKDSGLWRERFNAQTAALMDTFFRSPGMPPEWAKHTGLRSSTESAAGFALLSCAALADKKKYLHIAQQCAKWLTKQAIFPCRSFRLFFITIPDSGKDIPKKNVISDLSQTITALQEFDDKECKAAAAYLIRKAEKNLLTIPKTGTREKNKTEHTSLDTGVYAAQFALRGYKDSVIDSIIQETQTRLSNGNIATNPDLRGIHIGTLIDAVTTYSLLDLSNRQLLDYAIALCKKAHTPEGLKHYKSGAAGMAAKYNFLMLKLAVLDYLMQAKPEAHEQSKIKKVFFGDC